MQRIFLNNVEFENRIFNKENYHHLVNVLRLNKGQVEVCYDNKIYLVEIHLNDNDLSFDLLNEIKYNHKDYQVTIIQGSAKQDKNEDIIKYLTELDVNEIIFVDMIRSVSLIYDKKDKKLQRYHTIMENSSNQAHRSSLVHIDIKKNLKDIDYSQYELKLLLDEEEAKKDNPLYLNKDLLNKNSICLVVGPEGGIDDKERNYLIQNGFIPVAISNTILRTEMAGMVSVAMIEALKR